MKERRQVLGPQKKTKRTFLSCWAPSRFSFKFLFAIVMDEFTKGIQDEVARCMLFADIVLIDEIRNGLNSKLEQWRHLRYQPDLRVFTCRLYLAKLVICHRLLLKVRKTLILHMLFMLIYVI